ncbi:MAG: hypothetical protein KAR20_07815 [Candidatus Heimdallarchaeota archaeon]|nr:hypothetical protein [Candidatus Heimdallarchaeota archaeon]
MSDEIKYEDPKCQSFNEWLDEDGEVTIANVPFQRSRILFDMETAVYKQALNEFLEQDFEDLKQFVFDYYPSCIAYNLRLSEKGEGSSDPVRKLLHLKDTWESIVFVLYALVMGEIRSKCINLKAVKVFVSHDSSGNPLYGNLNTDRILSDAIKQKIQNIKGIVQYARANSVGFKCEEIDIGLLNDLLQLQDIRNDISHHAAPTREQAEIELKQVSPIFRDMLTKTRFFVDCKILRFEIYSSALRCEAFNGHSLNKEYDDINLPADQTSFIIGLGQEQLFVLWNNECFSLSPFLHYERDSTGHESYLCFYKGKKERKYWYEPIKIRTEKTFDHLQSRFEAEKNEITNLVVP